MYMFFTHSIIHTRPLLLTRQTHASPSRDMFFTEALSGHATVILQDLHTTILEVDASESSILHHSIKGDVQVYVTDTESDVHVVLGGTIDK